MLDSDQEKRYREPLYGLLESVKAARAALYLMEPDGEFRLVVQYGFSPREMPPGRFGNDYPVLERVQHFRRPFFYNSPREDESLGPLMTQSRTARILVSPLYDNGRLVGIVDLRDKAGNELFGPDDLKMALTVGSVLLKVRRSILGIPDPPTAPSDFPVVAQSATPPPPPDFHDRAAAAPQPVRETLSHPQAYTLPAPRAPLAPLTQREAVLLRGFASALLLQQSVAAVTFSLCTEDAVEYYIASRGPVTPDGRDAMIASASGAFERLKPGRPLPRKQRFNEEFPHGAAAPPLSRAGIAAAQTSVVSSDEGRCLLFTLVFSAEPDSAALAAVKETHLLVRRALSEVRESIRFRDAYRGLVRAFLEPGLKKHATLVAHSLAVGKMARHFAEYLRLSPEVVEQITVAAMLHDVGLRELSYERLSQKRPLSEAEYRLARDHPAVGAMLLADVDFPQPIAPIIYHHHERYDGSGYPGELRGDQIPFGARLIHIVEAFDAMTAPHSYQDTMAPAAAQEVIASKAGTHFDPDLARRFGEFLSARGEG